MNLLVYFVIYGHSWCFESSQIALPYGSCNFENFQNITRAHKSRNALAFIRFPIHIRMHTIRYSKEKAKQKTDEERMIQQEYEEASRRFEKDPSDYNQSRLNEIKEELELFYKEKTNGVIVRGRASWH